MFSHTTTLWQFIQEKCCTILKAHTSSIKQCYNILSKPCSNSLSIHFTWTKMHVIFFPSRYLACSTNKSCVVVIYASKIAFSALEVASIGEPHVTSAVSACSTLGLAIVTIWNTSLRTRIIPPRVVVVVELPTPFAAGYTEAYRSPKQGTWVNYDIKHRYQLEVCYLKVNITSGYINWGVEGVFQVLGTGLWLWWSTLLIIFI